MACALDCCQEAIKIRPDTSPTRRISLRMVDSGMNRKSKLSTSSFIATSFYANGQKLVEIVQCEVVRLTNGPEHGIKCVPVLLSLRPAGVSGIPHGLGAGQTGDDGDKDYLVGRHQVLVSAIIRMVPAPFDLNSAYAFGKFAK
jgi:hypothetical protein